MALGDLLNGNMNRGFIFSNGRPAPFVLEMVHLGPFERFSGRDMRFGDLSCCRCAGGGVAVAGGGLVGLLVLLVGEYGILAN